MFVKLNEKLVELPDICTAKEAAGLIKRDADILIINGFPATAETSLQEGDSLVCIRRGEMPSLEELEAVMMARHTPGVHAILKQSKVGIAGVGGLGSNIAIALSRVGVGELVIVDFDVVEPSNLNRQQYFIDQIGEYKVDALCATLSRINPNVLIQKHAVMLNAANIPEIFRGCQVIVEAFDRAEQKSMLVDTVMERMNDVPVLAASGVAGYGSANSVVTRKISDRLYVTGDNVSEAGEWMGLMAPRVGIAASHQANMAMRLLLGEKNS